MGLFVTFALFAAGNQEQDHGRTHKDSTANTVRNHLVNEFWRALYAYVDKARDKSESSGKDFVFIEVLESFMERYDIRCSPDMHERAALKRNYNRRRKNYKFTEEDYIEHG